MNGVFKNFSFISRALVCAISLAVASVASAQTHCDAGQSYAGPCQGVETYVNLDGTNSGGAGALSFSWSTDCPNSDLLNPTTATPLLILYGPGTGTAVDCRVYLQVNDSGACGCEGHCTCIDQCEATVQIPSCYFDCENTLNGTKVLDRCGVCGGDGNSCLGCSNVDIMQEQFALDGNSFALKKLVNDAIRDLRKIARLQADKNFAKNSNKEAEKLYTQSWTLAWALPHIVTTCTNQVYCTSTNNAPTIQSFLAGSDGLNKLLKKVVKRTQSVRHKKLNKDSVLLAKGEAAHQQNLTTASGLPTIASACTPS